MRAKYWAALAGERKGLIFVPEILCVAAMLHDFRLAADYGESHLRYEVGGANAARDLRGDTDFRKMIASESGLRSRRTRKTEFPELFLIVAPITEGTDVDLVSTSAKLGSPV
ncbi:hypothetical protein [Microvirga yunnanensis]|uniref:hypothetical protein n=1 Tax=Microvirga yunnanensis TaxID=2953740 RepID=UPI0021C6D501|nr:hypothetical protein [Microvirga sp. HBU65207]